LADQDRRGHEITAVGASAGGIEPLRSVVSDLPDLPAALPPETPAEARIAVRRLIELTTILARRCAQLQQALDSRIVIEQAKGVLSARLDVPIEQSFDLLRRAARDHRLKLREVAAEVVTSGTVPPKISGLAIGTQVQRDFEHSADGEQPPAAP